MAGFSEMIRAKSQRDRSQEIFEEIRSQVLEENLGIEVLLATL
jgi:hypothetical protein